MAKKNSMFRIYEINDIFSVMGYSLLFMGAISQFSNLKVQVIAVDSIVDVFKGLFNTSATGNMVALTLGVGALFVEKYVRYGTIY